MATTLKAAVDEYLRANALARGTRNEYFSTLRKWEQWGGDVPIEELRRKDLHATSDILNGYTSLDPTAAMQEYFETIRPLLAAIAVRTESLNLLRR